MARRRNAVPSGKVPRACEASLVAANRYLRRLRDRRGRHDSRRGPSGSWTSRCRPRLRGRRRPAPKLTKPPADQEAGRADLPARRRSTPGIAGDVTLAIDIAADGHVAAVAVTTSGGHGFDEAAAAAAREMEFVPGGSRRQAVGRFASNTRSISSPGWLTGPHRADGGAPSPTARPPADGGAPSPTRARRAAARPPPAPARVVVRGQIRERGTREPLVGADVALIRRGAAPAAATGPPRWSARPTTTAASRSASADPGDLRVLVSDTAHEPCVRDFTAAELGGPNPVEWSCFAPQARRRPQRDARPGARRAPRGDEGDADQGRADHRARHASAIRCACCRTCRASRARRSASGLLIVRGANPSDTGVFIGGEPIPVLYHFLAGTVGVHGEPDRQDRLLPGRFRRPVRPLHRAASSTSASRATSAGRCTARSTSTCATRRPTSEGPAAGRRAHELRVPAQLHRRDPAADPAVLRPHAGRVRRSSPSRRCTGTIRRASTRTSPGGGAGRRCWRTAAATRSSHLGRSDRRARVRHAHRLSPRDGRVGRRRWATWSSRLSATYGYGDQSLSTGAFGGYQRYHRLWGREDVSRRFSPKIALSAGLDFVLSYDWAHYSDLPFPRDGRTIGTTMPPTMVDVERSLYDTAPAVYVEAQWNITPRLRVVPGAALRLLPRRQDRQDLVRPAGPAPPWHHPATSQRRLAQDVPAVARHPAARVGPAGDDREQLPVLQHGHAVAFLEPQRLQRAGLDGGRPSAASCARRA